MTMYDAFVQRRRQHHLPDEVYENDSYVVFLTACSAKRGLWLVDSRLASVVREEILRLHGSHPVLGYCIMPDHVHLLICNSGNALSTIVNLFKGRVSRRVRQIDPELDVWQPGYWDHIVRREEGLFETLRYTFLNPVRAGLVEDWWDYAWLGSPMLGEVGPGFFTAAPPEDIVWREVFAIHDDP